MRGEIGEPFLGRCRETSSDFSVPRFSVDQLPLDLFEALLVEHKSLGVGGSVCCQWLCHLTEVC